MLSGSEVLTIEVVAVQPFRNPVGEMTTPLLQTKLYLPPAGPNLVFRPRLIERLDEGIHTTKMTLISAPAGYGKTTLLSEWFTSGDRSVAWPAS